MSKLILAKEKKRERGPQMKRSPPSSSSSSCSSSASSKETLPPHPPLQPTKSKTKRTRRNLNPKKPQFGYSSGRRSSVYRGVTRHRWTGRYEAHLWDKNSWNPVQTKKGRQVYLGAYDDEEAAAHTYDLAALKYWGPDTILNFPLITYAKEFKEMQNVSKEEYLATLRRRSSGFSRGVSKYRGVARHHHNGRWEARIGRVFGNKYLYLGTYSTQEEAAEAYDRAAIRYRGLNAVTNFDISHYTNNQQLQPLQQQQQQTTIQFSTEAQESSAASQIPNPELPVSVDHHHQATVLDAMHEHPWSLHMDSEFNPLPVPDIAFDKSSELPDLFDGNGFEDDIDFLFDSSKENGISLDGIFENSGGFEGDLLRDVEEQGLMGESLSSSTSSSSVQYPYPITICS